MCGGHGPTVGGRPNPALTARSRLANGAAGGRPGKRVTTCTCPSFESSARSRSTPTTARRSPSAARSSAPCSRCSCCAPGEVVSTDVADRRDLGRGARRGRRRPRSRTRSSRPPQGARAGPARTKPPGYVLEVNGELARPPPVRAAAAARRPAQEPAERARLLREALDLWRGEPLAEFAFEPFARRASAASRSSGCRARRSGSTPSSRPAATAELVPQLESLVAEHPLPRAARRAADARALPRRPAGGGTRGVPGRAPRARRRARRLDPGPQLQQLHALDPPAGGRPPPVRGGRRRRRSTSRRSPALILAGGSCRCSARTSPASPPRLAARFDYPAERARRTSRASPSTSR